MQIRRRHGRRWKDVPLLPILILAAPIVLIFLVASHQRRAFGLIATTTTTTTTTTTITTSSTIMKTKVPQEETTTTTTTTNGNVRMIESKPRISYTLVAEEGDSSSQHSFRYVATEEWKDGSSHAVTIERWAQLMAHNDTDYAQQLAMNLTQILKVRDIINDALVTTQKYIFLVFCQSGCSRCFLVVEPFLKILTFHWRRFVFGVLAKIHRLHPFLVSFLKPRDVPSRMPIEKSLNLSLSSRTNWHDLPKSVTPMPLKNIGQPVVVTNNNKNINNHHHRWLRA